MVTDRPVLEAEIAIDVTADVLIGDLAVPVEATGTVIFAHGSGSSRHSRRNREVVHLFEEPGALEQVAELATDHLRKHLR